LAWKAWASVSLKQEYDADSGSDLLTAIGVANGGCTQAIIGENTPTPLFSCLDILFFTPPV